MGASKKAAPRHIPPPHTPTSGSASLASRDAIDSPSRRNYAVHGLLRGESFSSDGSVPAMVEDQYGTSDSDLSVEEDGYHEAMSQLWDTYGEPSVRNFYTEATPYIGPTSPSQALLTQCSHNLKGSEPATFTASGAHRPSAKRSMTTLRSPEAIENLPPAPPCPQFPPPLPPPQRKIHSGTKIQSIAPQTRLASRSVSNGHSHLRRPTQLSLFPSNSASLPSEVCFRPSTAPSSRVNQSFSTPVPAIPCNSSPRPTPSPERSVFEYDSDDNRRHPKLPTSLPSSLTARFHFRSLSGSDKRLGDKEKEKRRQGLKMNGSGLDMVRQERGTEGEEKTKKSFRRSAGGFVRGFLGLGRR